MRAAAFQHVRINQLVVELEDGGVRPVGVQQREDSRVVHRNLVDQALLVNLTVNRPKHLNSCYWDVHPALTS